MPNYDLRCTECKNEFRTMASISDRTEHRITCPECGSRTLDAIFKSANFSIKGSQATTCPNSHICGAGCSHM